jgi:hypothetical protein
VREGLGAQSAGEKVLERAGQKCVRVHMSSRAVVGYVTDHSWLLGQEPADIGDRLSPWCCELMNCAFCRVNGAL